MAFHVFVIKPYLQGTYFVPANVAATDAMSEDYKVWMKEQKGRL